MLLHPRTRRQSEPPGQELSCELYLYVPRALSDQALTDGVPASTLRPQYPWAPLADVNIAWGYLELSTAIAEALHRERRVAPPGPLPREARTFSVRLQAVRDLRLPEEQRHFGLTLADLLNTAPTGRAHWASELACKEGAEGLWVPSAICTGGSVLVIFPGNLLPGSYFRPASRA